MAKESGLGWTRFEVDDSAGPTAQDIKNDILAADWDHPRETLDVTGLDKSAHERLVGLADFTINFTAGFNDAAAPSSFDCLKTIASTDVTRTVGITISGQILNNECILTSAALTRGADGSFQFGVTGVLQSGTDPSWTT
tara:strand:+ start:283 stop:699 length:417 start_codon:yes stop_codon:yes gene_type:complete